MKTTKHIFLFMLVSLFAQSQTTYTVVDHPNADISDLSHNTAVYRWKLGPVYTNKNYYLVASIYKASEIGTSGSISSFTFHWYGAALTSGGTRNYEVYMGHTTASEVSLTNPSAGYITASGMTKVFDNTISPPTADAEVTVTLDTPFNYNGTDNLAILYYDKTGTTTTSNAYSRSWDISGGTENRTLRAVSSATALDVNNPGWSATFNEIPCFKLTIEAVLPIELIRFEGHEENNSNILEWTTASEINADFVIIEKSIDCINFHQAGVVNLKGNSSIMTDYSFTDRDISQAVNYYRLNEYDIDGTHNYSNFISIDNTQEKRVLFITNYLGQIIELENYNGIIIKHYSDGTTVKEFKYY